MIKKTKISKCHRIAARIREELLASHVETGTPAASASEIAGQFGVSVPTAHNAINLLVKEGLLYRIRGSGTFIKDIHDRKRFRIGLADCSIIPLSAEMQKILNFHIDFVLNYLADQNCEVKVISYPELINARNRQDCFRNLDAFLVSYNYIDMKTIEIFKQTGLPVLLYRHEFDSELPFSQVIYDIGSGIAAAIEEAQVTAGDMPVVFYEKTPSGHATRNIFARQLLKADIPRECIQYFEIQTFIREVTCYRMVRVHSGDFRRRMIFTANDDLALALINAFYDEGMRPGEDYRLISIGNQEDYGLRLPGGPLIASINLPKKLMAEESCRLLLQMLQNKMKCPVLAKVPTTFVMRASAGYSGLKNTVSADTLKNELIL